MKPRFFLRKFGKLVIISFIVFVVSIIPSWFIIKFFEIKEIQIVGDDTIVVIDQARFPKNLIFFPAKQIEQQILNENPLINYVNIIKKYPHTLVINYSKSGPLAKLVSGGQNIILTVEGAVINFKDSNELPTIRIEIGELGISQKISDVRITRALRFLDEAKKSGLVIESIYDFDRLSLLAKMNKTDILFPQNNDVSTVVSTLQSLIVGFRIKGSMPTRIDLRFDKPIVSF